MGELEMGIIAPPLNKKRHILFRVFSLKKLKGNKIALPP
jgi:hypothetical protein